MTLCRLVTYTARYQSGGARSLSPTSHFAFRSRISHLAFQLALISRTSIDGGMTLCRLVTYTARYQSGGARSLSPTSHAASRIIDARDVTTACLSVGPWRDFRRL